jgi:hypothetical protein
VPTLPLIRVAPVFTGIQFDLLPAFLIHSFYAFPTASTCQKYLRTRPGPATTHAFGQQLAFDEAVDLDEPLIIYKVANDVATAAALGPCRPTEPSRRQVTYKRYKKALKLLGAYPPEGPAVALLDVIFGTAPPRFAVEADFAPVNAGLNDSQVDAATPLSMRARSSARTAPPESARACEAATHNVAVGFGA